MEMSRLNDHKGLFMKRSKQKLVENFTNSELQKKVTDKAVGWVKWSHFGPRSFFTSKIHNQTVKAVTSGAIQHRCRSRLAGYWPSITGADPSVKA